MKNYKFLLFILFAFLFNLHANDDLLQGNTNSHPRPFYLTDQNELRIGYFYTNNRLISNNSALLEVVSKNSEAIGLRLCSIGDSKYPWNVTWNNGIRNALLLMPYVKTLSFEHTIPSDFFERLGGEDLATNKISTFQSYGNLIKLDEVCLGFKNLNKIVLFKSSVEGLHAYNEKTTELRLWDCNLSNRELELFSIALPNLKSIRIAECSFVHRNSDKKFDDHTIEVLANLKHLEELSILTSNDGYYISTDFPTCESPGVWILDSIENHRSLELTNKGLASIKELIPDLRNLRLGKLVHVGDEGISHLSENLEVLHLEGLSDNFTDSGLNRIINSLPKLESLTIGGFRFHYAETVRGWRHWCYGAKFSTITQNAFKNCKSDNLKTLHLLYCDKINDKTLLDLLEALPNLESLTLTYCPNITKEGIKMLEQLKPELMIFVPEVHIGTYRQYPLDS